MLSEGFRVPVRLGNDADCALLAELRAGRGRNHNSFILLTLGTGIGGGIVLDGKPYRTGSLKAGEFGHMILRQGGRRCGCGQRGCFEQYASATALLRLAKQAIGRTPESVLAKLSVRDVTGETFFQSVKMGCPIAQRVLKEYIDALAAGIVSLIRILRP